MKDEGRRTKDLLTGSHSQARHRHKAAAVDFSPRVTLAGRCPHGVCVRIHAL